ncbi:MAG TPA: ABC transporter ATP-binding protein [Vitreimonas sp.]|uniref:ABC transporter ATP-binding protein n=1 Tax=Vitreimonas sp. TaxID=3069702 RepID=UPI002D53B796|nr:ABC transporter ATP-binding protein [Vitreimonas sp.]HYD86057.1 ABC transporter ATP-binding protein [Vitreimonas sp.]
MAKAGGSGRDRKAADAPRPAHVLVGLFIGAADRAVWLRLGAAVAAAATAAALAVAAPVALKFLLDTFSGQGAAGAGPLALVVLYVGALGGARLAEQAQAYCFGTGEQRLQQRLNSRMFAHVLALPMGFHLDRPTGGLAQSLTLGLQGARIIMTHATFSVLPVVVQAVLITVVVIEVFDLAVWLVVTGAIFAYAIVFAWGVRRLAGPTREVSAAQIEAGGQFNDGLVNVEPVKAFGAEDFIGQRYHDLLGEAERRWRVFHARRCENGLLAAIVFAISFALVLALGARAFLLGEITIGDFALLNAYMLQLVRPIEMMGFALRDMAQGAVYLERWAEFLRLAPETEVESQTAPSRARPAPGKDAPSARSLSAPEHREDKLAPEIRFEAVRFRYGEKRQILSDVSFTVAAGTVAAVVGPSGAGKSSLVRLLLRYYAPEAGRILIGGLDVESAPIKRVRAMIALVSQDTVLFNATLRRNIAFARPDASAEEIEEAVRRARLGATLARLPEGLDTLVGERGLKLSGGERQRVAIARAALKRAPILVLDEATSALDAITENEVWADMLEAASGRTALIVTHRLSLAAHADKIIVLDAGQVVEEGAHAPLLAAEGAYARMWRRNQERSNEPETI